MTTKKYLYWPHPTANMLLQHTPIVVILFFINYILAVPFHILEVFLKTSCPNCRNLMAKWVPSNTGYKISENKYDSRILESFFSEKIRNMIKIEIDCKVYVNDEFPENSVIGGVPAFILINKKTKKSTRLEGYVGPKDEPMGYFIKHELKAKMN